MDPITLATLGLSLARLAIPEIQKLVERGEVSADEQKRVMDEFTRLKTHATGLFDGPEWKVSESAG